jgi:hypothetical protein
MVSEDGCWVAFGSSATNLTDLGGGGAPDGMQVFLSGPRCPAA